MAFDILLLRGLSREQGHWNGFPDRLLKVEGVNSIHFVDLPGNGQYYKLSSPLSIGEMAEFVKSHDPIPADRKKVIVAISMGAMVAVEMLHRYDEDYQAAILMNTSISGLSPVYKRIRPNALEHFYKILRSSDYRDRERNILKMVSNFPEKQEKTLEAWTQLAHSRPTTHFNSLRQLIAAGKFRLPKVKPKTPIYLLTSKADRMVDYHCSMQLSAKWDLPIAVHAEAGHELALDAPDWVCENIQAWLKEITQES